MGEDMEGTSQEGAGTPESQELFSEGLSKPAQEALDVFLTDEHAVSASFYDVMKAACEAAFHEGGDGVETLILGMENRIGNGVLRHPIETFVTQAVSQAYSGHDGTETFDAQMATTNLQSVLAQFGPHEKVSEVFEGIVQSSSNCRFQDIMKWALSGRVVKILEDHYARLCRDYIPQVYETLVRESPVEYIARFIRNKLISVSVADSDLCGVLHQPEMNLRLLIFSLINAEMPGMSGPFGHYTFDVFRSHFIHALRKAGDLFREQIPLDTVAGMQFETRVLVGQFLKINLWDQWLRKIWDEARAEEKFLRAAKERESAKSRSQERTRRDDIVAGNARRERDHGEKRRRNFAPTPNTGGHRPRIKKHKPTGSLEPIPASGEYQEVSPGTANVLYQISSGRRILAYLYNNGANVTCIISLEREKRNASNGENLLEYLRLFKVNFGKDAAKKGAAGIKRTLQSAFYGQGRGASKYMRGFGISSEEIRGVPCDLARHICNFSRVS